MFKSVVQVNTNQCFYCGVTNGLDWHHIMNGAKKSKSEQYGGMVRLCKKHHTMGGRLCVHDNPTLKTQLKKDFQFIFEKKYSREQWLKEFGKNYL